MGLGVGKSVGDSVPGLSTPNSMSLYFVFIFYLPHSPNKQKNWVAVHKFKAKEYFQCIN